MGFNGTIDYFVNTVFHYPTLAECYKIAALDGLNRLGVVRLTRRVHGPSRLGERAAPLSLVLLTPGNRSFN